MDCFHHCILVDSGRSGSSTPAPEPKDDDGMMSTKLYLALCGATNKDAVAIANAMDLLPPDDQLADRVSVERNNVFHLAAEQGHTELIRKLHARLGNVLSGSLLSSPNSAKDTPLHCAARAGHDVAVTVLVNLARDCGEDKTVLWWKNEAGDTALHLAARLGHAKAVQAMVSKAPGLASVLNDAGVSPLYLAVMSKEERAVEAITTSCRDALAAGPCSQNALHAAVFQGKGMVKLLLDWKPCGPSLANEADGSGSTPLHFASSDGDSSVVDAILRAVVPPCDARAQDKGCLCAWGRRPPPVSGHASISALVRMQDKGGLSALHVAAEMGHARVAKVLMQACPDAAELRDDRGGTFLHAAARGGHCKVVALATAKKPRLHLYRGLLNTQDGDGNTALHLAVAARTPAVAEDLLSNGKVQADVMNKDGHTPLDLAVTSTSFFSMLGLVVTLAAFRGQPRPQRRDHVEQWKGRDIAKGIEKTSDSLAVVAVLIATVAFTAANNVPGAYEQADAPDGKTFLKGMAVLQRENLFKCFLVLDSFALVTSVIAVVLLIFGKASRSAGSWKTFAVALHCLWAALISMLVAFYAALSAVTTTRAVSVIVEIFIYYGFAVLYYTIYYLIAPRVLLSTVWKVVWRTFLEGRNSVFRRRRIRQQYPVASAYALNLLLFKTMANLGFLGTIIISVLSRKANTQ